MSKDDKGESNVHVMPGCSLEKANNELTVKELLEDILYHLKKNNFELSYFEDCVVILTSFKDPYASRTFTNGMSEINMHFRLSQAAANLLNPTVDMEELYEDDE